MITKIKLECINNQMKKYDELNAALNVLSSKHTPTQARIGVEAQYPGGGNYYYLYVGINKQLMIDVVNKEIAGVREDLLSMGVKV